MQGHKGQDVLFSFFLLMGNVIYEQDVSLWGFFCICSYCHIIKGLVIAWIHSTFMFQTLLRSTGQCEQKLHFGHVTTTQRPVSEEAISYPRLGLTLAQWSTRPHTHTNIQVTFVTIERRRKWHATIIDITRWTEKKYIFSFCKMVGDHECNPHSTFFNVMGISTKPRSQYKFHIPSFYNGGGKNEIILWKG